MRTLIALLVFIGVATGAAVVYSGTTRTYVLNKFIAHRSKVAKGQQQWHDYEAEYDYQWGGGPKPPVKYYPPAKKMYSLQWNASLATAAVNRLNTLSGSQMTGTVPSSVGEITHGVLYGIAPNTMTAQAMFDAAWSSSWGNYLNSFGLPSMAYQPNSGNNYYNFNYQIISGQTTQIGCAYINMTNNQYATVCHMYPRALGAGVSVYLAGTTFATACTQCPNATAPCNSVNKLCVIKASG
ncbi:unnamed protein product, partial [Mesorhabditis belari]|uniref:SCP domain-containing protein n=1 Tax=Mesorhabditis belari TaxID=2138241 RepID=A0AAF3FPB3_9BILA